MAGRLDHEVGTERQQFLDRTSKRKAAGGLPSQFRKALRNIEHAEQTTRLAASLEAADDLLGDGAEPDNDDPRLPHSHCPAAHHRQSTETVIANSAAQLPVAASELNKLSSTLRPGDRLPAETRQFSAGGPSVAACSPAGDRSTK